MDDMLCDDNKGNHWAMLSMGDGRFKDAGAYKTGWCLTSGMTTSHYDFNGDGKADLLCDDIHGSHWAILIA